MKSVVHQPFRDIECAYVMFQLPLVRKDYFMQNRTVVRQEVCVFQFRAQIIRVQNRKLRDIPDLIAAIGHQIRKCSHKDAEITKEGMDLSD